MDGFLDDVLDDVGDAIGEVGSEIGGEIRSAWMEWRHGDDYDGLDEDGLRDDTATDVLHLSERDWGSMEDINEAIDKGESETPQSDTRQAVYDEAFDFDIDGEYEEDDEY